MGIVTEEAHSAGWGAAVTSQRCHGWVGRDSLAEGPVGLWGLGGAGHIDGAGSGNRHTGAVLTYANGFGIAAVRGSDQIRRSAGRCQPARLVVGAVRRVQ